MKNFASIIMVALCAFLLFPMKINAISSNSLSSGGFGANNSNYTEEEYIDPNDPDSIAEEYSDPNEKVTYGEEFPVEEEELPPPDYPDPSEIQGDLTSGSGNTEENPPTGNSSTLLCTSVSLLAATVIICSINSKKRK